MDREKQVIKVGLQGILMNVLLVIFKLIVGLLANSIAIILDAVNNATDTISAIVTIVGAKLSGKAPDREHPYGHGRIEYVAASIISLIVFAAGVASFKESIDKIINPNETNYSYITLIVVLVAVFVKYFFGKHAEKIGKKLESRTLIATSADALMDAFLSLGTFFTAIIGMTTSLKIDGYVGVIISIFILRSSINILMETLDTVIGARIKPEISKEIKEFVLNHDEVYETSDLMLHSYGADSMVGSINIQVDENMLAKDIDSLTRKIEEEVMQKFNINLTIGIYATNNSNFAKKIKDYVEKIAKEYKEIIQVHGFYFDDEKKIISFDIIFDFDVKNEAQIKNEIIEKIKKKYRKYKINICLDKDITD